jgi:hypothetical protein
LSAAHWTLTAWSEPIASLRHFAMLPARLPSALSRVLARWVVVGTQHYCESLSALRELPDVAGWPCSHNSMQQASAHRSSMLQLPREWRRIRSNTERGKMRGMIAPGRCLIGLLPRRWQQPQAEVPTQFESREVAGESNRTIGSSRCPNRPDTFCCLRLAGHTESQIDRRTITQDDVAMNQYVLAGTIVVGIACITYLIFAVLNGPSNADHDLRLAIVGSFSAAALASGSLISTSVAIVATVSSTLVILGGLWIVLRPTIPP